MNVLVITHNFPRTRDDFVGRFVLDLARATEACGVASTVIAPLSPGARRAEVMDGVRVRRVPFAPRCAGDFAASGDIDARVRSLPWGPIFLASMNVQMLRAALRLAAASDVVHSHWWAPSGAIGHVVASWAGKPHVVTLHGSDVALVERSAALRRAATRVLTKAAAVAVVSSNLRERLESALGAKLHGTFVCPMPVRVPDREPVPSPNAGRLIGVGRFVASKGHDDLLRVMRLLRDRGRDVTLDLVGGGPLYDHVRRESVRLGLESVVRFHGPVPSDRVGALLDGCDVFVLLPRADPTSGRQEGFGIAFAEALLRGRPVVATRTGGVGEAVGPGAILVDEGDTVGAARAVERLLDDPVLARRMADEGSRYVRERFTPEVVGRRFARVYRDVAKGKSSNLNDSGTWYPP